MTYINNQYLKLDIPLEDIAKIKIYTDENNKLIEDLEINEEPNIVIAYGEKVNYNNIFSLVKILITDKKAIKNNDYIPEHIETIIIYGYIYGNNKTEIERLKLGLKNGNDLFLAIDNKNEEKILELIENVEINVGMVDDNKLTVLYWACYYNMPGVAMKLIDRMSNEAINKWTILFWACKNNITELAIKLVDRMSDEAINKRHYDGRTALYLACNNNMVDVAMELIDRLSYEAINKDGKKILRLVKKNNMEKIELKLKDRMNKK